MTATPETERQQGVGSLPEGCKHLHGAMHLIPFSLLQMPDTEPTSPETGDYEFRNPRILTQKGQLNLLDKRLSSDLRQSIRNNTLLVPIVCRWINKDGKVLPQVVGGDRRYRALEWLIRKKETVKDPSSVRLNDQGEYEYEWHTADVVYDKVLCQVFAAKSDLEALALAYAENQCRQNLTDGHDIAMVMELRQHGANDEKIMEIMQKEEKWLRDTDNLIQNLDESSLKELIEDRIDREAALELAKIEDVDLRTKIREVADAKSAEDSQRKYTRLQKKVMSALDEQEIAEGSLADAAYSKDDGRVAEAQAELEQTQARVNRTIREREKASQPVTTGKNVKAAVEAVTGRKPSGPRQSSLCLREARIKECYLEPLTELVRNHGKHKDGFIATVDGVKLAVKLVKGILSGNPDAIGIVKRHTKRQEE